MLKKRYLTAFVVEDLKEKMVFISGPRQVGKTTLSKELVPEYFSDFAYFNWDLRADREKIMRSQWPTDAELIILDEIHKYRKWKGLIKGNYDKFKEDHRFLVTGSARLNVYRKGGDSLQGRYHHYRLHPFSLAELSGESKIKFIPFEPLKIDLQLHEDTLETLFHFGGFPEPLIKQNNRQLRRWHNEKIDRLFREDIREIEMIRDMGSIQLLSDMLPLRVGSLLSLNSLREDLEVSHRTVSHWMNVLEEFYYHFRIYPFTNHRVRSLKKEPKLYLWDWSEIEDQGKRFENLVASHLLKFVHFLQDHEGYKASLHFLRDKDKREVDFLVAVDDKPWFACEVKLTDAKKSNHLEYFQDRLKIPYIYQIIKDGKEDYVDKGIRVLPASKFLFSLV